LLLKKFVTGANARIRKDLASSVFTERSPFDLGLEGGLGGFSVIISSVDDASTLVRDDPPLILPLISRVGDSDACFFLRLEPGLSARSSSSSLLDEFAEVD
jgi:hypothetical protein